MPKIWGGSPRVDRVRRLENSCLRLATGLDRDGDHVNAALARVAAKYLNTAANNLER